MTAARPRKHNIICASRQVDRWGRITGTPLVLPPAKANQGALAGYPRQTRQTARALAFTPAASGARPPAAALETAGESAACVAAATSPETSTRKVLHSGHWAMAAVGESTAGSAVPLHDQTTDHEVQIIFCYSFQHCLGRNMLMGKSLFCRPTGRNPCSASAHLRWFGTVSCG